MPPVKRKSAIGERHSRVLVIAEVAVLAVVVAITAQALAQPPRIYAPDGTYLGNLSANQFDPDSVSNPFGRYGSRYSPDSINNPYGRYGSPYSPNSVRNPFVSGGSHAR